MLKRFNISFFLTFVERCRNNCSTIFFHVMKNKTCMVGLTFHDLKKSLKVQLKRAFMEIFTKNYLTATCLVV